MIATPTANVEENLIGPWSSVPFDQADTIVEQTTRMSVLLGIRARGPIKELSYICRALHMSCD